MEKYFPTPRTMFFMAYKSIFEYKGILNHDLFMEVFCKDISLGLQAILIDRKYANLHNQAAHGLMPSDHFYSFAPIYLWWFIMRFCLILFYSQWSSKHQEELDKAPENDA